MAKRPPKTERRVHPPETRARAHALYREYKAQGVTRFMTALLKRLKEEGHEGVTAAAVANWRVDDRWNDETVTMARDAAVTAERVRNAVQGADLRNLNTLTGVIESLTITAFNLTTAVQGALAEVKPTTVAELLDVAKAAALIARSAMDMRLQIIGRAPDVALPVAAAPVIEATAEEPAPAAAPPAPQPDSVRASIAQFEKGRRGVQSH